MFKKARLIGAGLLVVALSAVITAAIASGDYSNSISAAGSAFSVLRHSSAAGPTPA